MPLLRLQRAARVLSWLAAFAILFVSLVPGEARPHTLLPPLSEHFIAYLALAALLEFGYRERIRPLTIALVLSALAGVLEVAQIWVPGRHAHVLDLIVSAGGAFTGAALAWLVLRLWKFDN